MEEIPLDREHARVLACIEPDANAERVIRAAAKIAIDITAELYALHVELPGAHTRRAPAASRQLEELMRLAGDLGAQTAIIADHRIADAIAQYAQTTHITQIVVGRSQRSTLRHLLYGNTIKRLRSLIGSIPITEV